MLSFEMVAFTKITGVEGGRIGNLSQGVHSPTYEHRSRLATVDLQEYILSPREIFDNVYPEASANVLLGAALVCVFLYLLKVPMRKSEYFLLLIVLLITGFMGHAYSATTAFPFDRPERFLPRYFLDIYTWGLLFLSCFLALVIRQLSLQEKPAKLVGVVSWFALFIMFSSFFDLTKSYRAFTDKIKNGNSISILAQNRSAVLYAMDNQIPIVSLSLLPEKEPRWQDFCKFYVLYTPVSMNEFAERAIVHSKMKSHITLSNGKNYHVLFNTNTGEKDVDKYLLLNFDKRYSFIDTAGKRLHISF